MEKLLKEEIVPDVLDKLPRHKLTVNFGEKCEIEVNFGNLLPIKSVNEMPTKVSWPSEASKFYTLCLTDPDAPTRSSPSMKERCHWLVTNIPGNFSSASEEGEMLMSFVPSCPPKDSGLHRYTFVVFEQPSKLDFSADLHLEIWDNRKLFSIMNFARKYAMNDEPAAANFYVAQWDPDAQITRVKLGLV